MNKLDLFHLFGRNNKATNVYIMNLLTQAVMPGISLRNELLPVNCTRISIIFSA